MKIAIRAVAFLVVGLVLASPTGAQPGTSALLVSPRQLVRELGDPSLVLLHVGPPGDFEAGHVPGARAVTVQDFAALPVPGAPALELPDEAELRDGLEKLGIGDRSRIVVIAGADWTPRATRIVWTLQAAGLGRQTRLLDGGNEGWKRAGLAVSKDAPVAATPGQLSVPADRSIVVEHDWVQARVNAPGFHLIDARLPSWFAGPGVHERGTDHGAGHIPGARNVPFNTLYNDSLQFLPLPELRRIFGDAGVQAGDTVVAYCHIGQQATVVLFAARLLGHPVKLYDGSFTEWDALKLPVENPTASKAPETHEHR